MKYKPPQAKITIGVHTAGPGGSNACSPSCSKPPVTSQKARLTTTAEQSAMTVLLRPKEIASGIPIWLLKHFPLAPREIVETLNLRRPIYKAMTSYGLSAAQVTAPRGKKQVIASLKLRSLGISIDTLTAVKRSVAENTESLRSFKTC